MNNKIFKEKKIERKIYIEVRRRVFCLYALLRLCYGKRRNENERGSLDYLKFESQQKKGKSVDFFLNGKMVFTHIQYKSKRTFYLHVCLRLILSFCDILTRVEWDIICFKWKREYRHERQVTRLSQTTKR